MASKDRPNISKSDYAFLINEVDSLCPLCAEQLIYFKNSKSTNLAQAAHIYPHSPSAQEAELLENMPRITDEVDSISNLIMLCPTCHSKFDHPRTIEEYLVLYKIKMQLIERYKAREHYKSHDIESDICGVFNLLEKELNSNDKVSLSYHLVCIDAKLDGCASVSLPNIIKRDVREYYLTIYNILQEVEKDHPGISESFAMSVKSLCKKYMRLNLSKELIYESINEWLNQKTGNKYQYLIPFLTAFYIQNCEVF